MHALSETPNELGTRPIGKLLVKFAAPSIVAMLVLSLYNIVDQLFIGRGVGYLGNAACLHNINQNMGKINTDRDALLTLRMHGEIESDTYARKDEKFRNLLKRPAFHQKGQAQQKTEIGDAAMKVLELSQRI